MNPEIDRISAFGSLNHVDLWIPGVRQILEIRNRILRIQGIPCTLRIHRHVPLTRQDLTHQPGIRSKERVRKKEDG